MVKKLLAKATALRRSDIEHERMTSLINSMADGVLAVDKGMKIVLSNGAALNILDVNSTLHGQRLKSVIKLLDKNKAPVDIEKLVANTNTSTSTRDFLLAYSDHSTINLYLSIAPVHLGYGKTGHQGFVLLMRDITREKSLEEERDEFISVVSHELRTPIAIAEGNISNARFITEKSGDIEQIKKALKHAHDQILFLSDMINDLSTLSRAERGKLEIEVNEINTPELIKELAASFTPEAKAKGLSFKAAAGNAGVLRSSQLYVREVLQNLLTNSIKYTEKGGVTLTAEKTPSGVRFSVTDTGIGISKGDQERIFDKFFRSEDYRTRKTSGTGLGLYVTMKLARLIHAEIDIQSELNKGSVFSITIPDLGE